MLREFLFSFHATLNAAIRQSRRFAILPIAALAIFAANAQASSVCSRAIPVHARCEIAIGALHPTQPAVGMMRVEERVEKLKLKGETDFAEYTGKRPLPVVQAPDGGFYLTDGHHLASVLVRSGATRVTVEIIGRFEDPATFWNEMRARHWVYLFDAKGNPIKPSALPKRIADLADDPYRTLASYAEDAGYFNKTNAYFMEFEWARYFGSRMDWQPIDRMNLLYALQAAEKLACQPQARNLPGYSGPCKTDR